MNLEKKQILNLRKRWTEEAINEVIDKLIKGKDLTEIGTVRYGDTVFIDLRGLQYSGSIHNLNRENIDFSFGILKVGQIVGKRLENCHFVGFKMTGTLLVDKLRNCDFTCASLKDTHLSGEFHECSFREANLYRVSVRQKKFIKCDFSKSNLQWAHFIYCIFEDCLFQDAVFGRGSFAGSKFLDGDISEQNLQDTITKGIQLL
jgi:fluoroquinolone resistance protein